MNTSGDSAVWLLLLVFFTGLAVASALFVVLRHYTLRLLHWLSGKFLAAAPAPLVQAGRWAARGMHLIYGAALLCGGTALGLSVAIWRSSFPDWNDPLFRNPLFWLTWLGVMAAVMLLGIVLAVVARSVLAFGLAKLRKPQAPDRR
jgi:hypothetical protein